MLDAFPSFSEREKEIEYCTEDLEFILPDPDGFTNWINNVVTEEQNTVGLITYIFCSDAYLLSINKTHLKHDYYTDVITFPYGSQPIEGDIYISIDRIKENAKDEGVSFLNELSRVMIHGVFHLLGYDDKSQEQQLKMTGKENQALLSAPGV